ncbi:N-6 DNA methylase [Dactylosporangium sp. NPDC051485]|uniref:N-6 DNA methylase n=1 Tax=Dactylosporangium sp. NPDC051485 TaxID=3154846 RepID=UPI0034311DC0
MTDNVEVTAADVARIAGVGRAAVSNWRRRHADFPAPIGGTPYSPTFALADVEAWLIDNGRAANVKTLDTPAAQRPSESLESRLAGTMAALLPPLTDGTVFDPACGDGARLAAAAKRLGSGLRYVGRDLETAQLEDARSALLSVGATAVDLAVAPGTHTPGGAEALISVSPLSDRPLDGMNWEFGQPLRHDQPLAWAQFCLSQLKPGGVAVVAVPFSAATRASGRRIRAGLLRAGALTHVIGLPEGAVVGTLHPWQIWLLARQVGRPTYTLRMVDLTDRTPDDLPADEKAWAAVFTDPVHTRDVPSIELLDEDVLLLPTGHIEIEPRDVAPEYAALRDRYAGAVRGLDGHPPTFAPANGQVPGPLISLNDLAKSGALAFIDYKSARPGDVIVPAVPRGFDAFVLDEANAPEMRAGSAVRCDPAVLDPHFLACFLRAEINRRQASGSLGGTFRLDLRRARIPRMTPTEQRHYGEAFRRLTSFAAAVEEVAASANAAIRTAVDGLTTGTFAPSAQEEHGKRAR